MAKSSTSFAPGDRGNPSGRPPLTPEQRRAREMRAQCQPEIVEALLRIIRAPDADPKDVIAASRVLVEDLPSEGGAVLAAYAQLSLKQLEALAGAAD